MKRKIAITGLMNKDQMIDACMAIGRPEEDIRFVRKVQDSFPCYATNGRGCWWGTNELWLGSLYYIKIPYCLIREGAIRELVYEYCKKRK